MKLPGVGPKTASKYVFSLINWNQYSLNELTDDILTLNKHITHCDNCFNYSDKKICSICKDEKRDSSVICVVTNYPDLLSIESLGEYKGLYHILQGSINPIEGITPEHLTINILLNRIKQNQISEIILALNADIPGETTALYLKNILSNKHNFKISRIAKGLPMGSTLEYADQITISNAMRGRINL